MVKQWQKLYYGARFSGSDKTLRQKDFVMCAKSDGFQYAERLTEKKGVDVVFDPVGGAYSEPALRAIAWKGRYLVIGFTSSIPSIPLNLALLKGCQIVGVFWGSFCMREPMVNAANFQELFGMFEAGKIKPFVVETFPLEKTATAIEMLANREALGKITITIRD